MVALFPLNKKAHLEGETVKSSLNETAFFWLIFKKNVKSENVCALPLQTLLVHLLT